MAKRRSTAARRARQLSDSLTTLTDLYIDAMREISPRATTRLIDSGIQLLEAHREFLEARIGRLQQAKTRISKSASRGSRRKVAVRRTRVRAAT